MGYILCISHYHPICGYVNGICRVARLVHDRYASASTTWQGAQRGSADDPLRTLSSELFAPRPGRSASSFLQSQRVPLVDNFPIDLICPIDSSSDYRYRVQELACLLLTTPVLVLCDCPKSQCNRQVSIFQSPVRTVIRMILDAIKFTAGHVPFETRDSRSMHTDFGR